ncbi:MAG: hypothetical protein OEY56_14215, partial [Cyclobacteriaceae bacterium]|nr:hypothetical protein [Cyclobacteriaceae bacterium]
MNCTSAIVDALRYARYPYAFLTLGSCITVKTNVYLKSGGMNTRKAGEDFYFLHKIAPSCSLGEINQTTVYPADRISDRVPFGTGRALMLYEKEKEIMTYPFQVFEDIKHLMESWQELFAGQMPVFPESVAAFMAEQEFESTLKKIRTESPNLASFHKRFFTWWDGFRMLKYIHFARDHYYPMARLSESLLSLNSALWHVDSFPSSATEQLKCIREWDRGYGNQTR